MIKIAVSGKLGSGKDLFFELAKRHFPELEFHNEKMALKIYDIVNIIQEKLYVPRIKDGKLLQFIGNHYRDLYPNIWVDSFFTTSHNPNNNIIVTDIRYPNEFEECKKYGFKLIRVLRKEELRLNNLGNRDSKHISETALDDTPLTDYDFVINNNGSLELYEGAVIATINAILRER